MTSIQMRGNPLFTRTTGHETGRWGIPMLMKPSIPNGTIDLIAWSDTRPNDSINRRKGVHFFVDDYRFESIYRWPERSLQKLGQYKFVLTPDYSLYTDMPVWRQIESVGKSRWCGVWWQEHGLNVIPTVSWSDFSSYTYCFDCIECGSTVAVGMIGCKHSKRAFLNGYDAMLEKIQPELVICFGRPFVEMRGPVVPIDYMASRKGVR